MTDHPSNEPAQLDAPAASSIDPPEMADHLLSQALPLLRAARASLASQQEQDLGLLREMDAVIALTRLRFPGL